MYSYNLLFNDQNRPTVLVLVLTYESVNIKLYQVHFYMLIYLHCVNSLHLHVFYQLNVFSLLDCDEKH